MKQNRAMISILTALLVSALAGWEHPANASDKILVVTSFSILGDLAREVGGDRVAVMTLVAPNGDAHTFHPTPSDARHLGDAKVLVMNGLGLEGWMPRLQDASGFHGVLVTASAGVKPREMVEHSTRVTDPHAWQDLQNGKIYVANIRDGLAKADPNDKATFETNAERLIAEIDKLDAEVRAAAAKIPAERRKIITTHDAFGYFGAAYGFEFIAPEGISTESAPSAQDLARIVRQIKTERIPAVFLENVTDPRLVGQLSSETGAVIGGTLYSDSLSAPDGPAPTYLDMFRSNLRTMISALSE
ncbi:zinc/manganese transport system substrate-binding protein [Bradyrhizobium sp. USDA 4011]